MRSSDVRVVSDVSQSSVLDTLLFFAVHERQADDS